MKVKKIKNKRISGRCSLLGNNASNEIIADSTAMLQNADFNDYYVEQFNGGVTCLMKKISYQDSIKLNNSVVILGKFDGFHLGHQHLLDIAFSLKMEDAADHPDREPMQVVIFTFDVFPVRVLVAADADETRSEDAARMIQTIQTEEERFMDPVPDEADYIIEFPFNRETMSMEPEQFVEDVLVNKLGVRKIICGYDFQFGKKRRGNVQMLQELGKEKGFETLVVPKVMMHMDETGRDDTESLDREISSTWIREEIRKGHMEQATAMLGRPFVVTGIVQNGRREGQTTGSPTFCLEIPETKILPPEGVYATEVFYYKDPDRTFQGGISDSDSSVMICQGMTYIRQDPGGHRTLETFLFDFNGDLNNRQIAIWFFHFVRPEIESGGSDQWKEQIHKDTEAAREYFKILLSDRNRP